MTDSETTNTKLTNLSDKIAAQTLENDLPVTREDLVKLIDQRIEEVIRGSVTLEHRYKGDYYSGGSNYIDLKFKEDTVSEISFDAPDRCSHS